MKEIVCSFLHETSDGKIISVEFALTNFDWQLLYTFEAEILFKRKEITGAVNDRIYDEHIISTGLGNSLNRLKQMLTPESYVEAEATLFMGTT